jgi:hypothetical protein
MGGLYFVFVLLLPSDVSRGVIFLFVFVVRNSGLCFNTI